MAKFTAWGLRSKAPSYDEIPLQKTERDDHFAAVEHVSNIVRHDFYMERTLNKMCLSLTSDLVCRVLRASSRFVMEAFRFFNWARPHQPASYKPTSVKYEKMVKILARSKKYESMWKVIHEMKNQDLGLSAKAVCGIIEEFGRQGLTDQALEVFNKCRNFDCVQTIKVYNSLLFALCEVKMFHGAYALIERMVRKKVGPDKRICFIRTCQLWRSSGKMREAREFLENMSRKGFNPPVRGHDLLIEGLLNSGYLESAKEMVKKMTKEGFVPTWTPSIP